MWHVWKDPQHGCWTIDNQPLQLRCSVPCPLVLCRKRHPWFLEPGKEDSETSYSFFIVSRPQAKLFTRRQVLIACDSHLISFCTKSHLEKEANKQNHTRPRPQGPHHIQNGEKLAKTWEWRGRGEGGGRLYHHVIRKENCCKRVHQVGVLSIQEKDNIKLDWSSSYVDSIVSNGRCISWFSAVPQGVLGISLPQGI